MYWEHECLSISQTGLVLKGSRFGNDEGGFMSIRAVGIFVKYQGGNSGGAG